MEQKDQNFYARREEVSFLTKKLTMMINALLDDSSLGKKSKGIELFPGVEKHPEIKLPLGVKLPSIYSKTTLVSNVTFETGYLVNHLMLINDFKGKKHYGFLSRLYDPATQNTDVISKIQIGITGSYQYAQLHVNDPYKGQLLAVLLMKVKNMKAKNMKVEWDIDKVIPKNEKNPYLKGEFINFLFDKCKQELGLDVAV